VNEKKDSAKPPANKPGTALVTGTTQLIVPRAWYAEVADNHIISTYPMDSTDGRLAIFQALEDECQAAAERINTVLEVQHVVMHSVEINDEGTGEQKPEVRTVVVCGDGSRVAFVSRQVCKFFARLTMLGRPGPWNPPLKLLLKRVPMGGSHSGYRLIEQR
jgi:Phage Single-stranded DNA-binding protein